MKANIILANAKVLTMKPSRPRAEMVAVAGDKVLTLGGKDEIKAVRGRKTRVIDCAGKTVVPGFNDAHLHLFSLFRQLLSLDVSPRAVHSIEDIKHVIRLKAASLPPGSWISGTDYNEFYLAEKRCPTRWDLDEATPHHPVVLSHRSLHACVLNSLALEKAGIGRETAEPPGARIERDLETGEPNGLLTDMLSFIRSHVLPPFSPAELDEAFGQADRLFLSNGITSFGEATYTNGRQRWETVRRYQENGKLHSRVTMMTGPETRREFQEKGLATCSGDDMLSLGAVKFLLEVTPDQYDLNRQALEVHQAGWQLAFHAVAVETVNAAVTTLEYVRAHSPAAGRKHRIEHCAECPPHLVEKIRELGAVIVTQPANLYYNGERYLATVRPAQLPWLYRLRTPLEKGVIVAGSSDTPVVPGNPLMGIYAAVARRAESGQTLLPEESLTPEQAIKLFTANAAYASFDEDKKGTLAPGKLADIAVLSGDPTRVPVEQIKDLHVEMTMIGGEVLWER